MKSFFFYTLLLRVLLLVSPNILFAQQDDFSVQEVKFQSQGVVLAGSILIPVKPVAAVVIVHGSDPVKRELEFAKLLAKEGIAVLTYDKRGVGESGGVYVGPTVGTNNIDSTNLHLLSHDANAAINTLKTTLNNKTIKIGLIGFSQAGWIIPLAAEKNQAVNFMVIFSGPVITTLEQLRFQFYTNGNENFWDTHSESDAREHTKNDPDKYQFLTTDPKISLSKLFIPGLWIFGGKDIQVPVNLSMESLDSLIQKGKKYEYKLFPTLSHNTAFSHSPEPFNIAVEWIKNICTQKHKVSYDQLKEYEGLYEYINNTTLKIAASPIDTTLLCIINESRYPFTTIGKDLFLNPVKDSVVFLRNKLNKIVAYNAGKDTFNLLSQKINFPKQMWYPRLNGLKNYKYSYQQPKNDNDGLKTGNLDNTGLDKELLDEMVQKIIDGTYPNVHSVLIIKDGKLVFEEYFYEHNKNKLHELRSATKSFISALTGIAIDKKYLKSKDEKILQYFPEYTFKNNLDLKKQITIENLLTNQSGLDCDVYNPKATGNESQMAYEKDWVQYSLDLPMVDSAGGIGQYCSSNPIILGRIIEKATKMKLTEFANQTLFKDIGIKNFNWQFKPDPSSGETFCQLNLRSRDFAKLGLLYLNNGLWNGKQVIPKDWVEQSLSKHSVVAGLDYGYLWWTKYLDATGVRYYGKLAQGNGGQKIYIFKELNLVTVITAGHYNMQSSSNELNAKYILPAFNKK